jgi:hypothetical protein
MKTAALLILLAFTAFQSSAQQTAQKEDKLLFLQKAEKYRRMKYAGMTLTFGGSALAVAGVMKMVNAAFLLSSQTATDQNNAGAALYVVGAACAGVGTTLWIVGGINHGRYQRKYESVSAQLNFTPHSSGLKLTYRF